MASGEDGVSPQLPRGLLGRKGVPTVKGTRLPSLRGPRDLTLGGIPKKVFTPNIPARREKSKERPLEDQTDKAVKSNHKDERRGSNNVGERGRGRGRGHGRGANLIQSHSIFEQGPGARLLPKGNSNAPYEPFERGSSGGSSGSRPSVFKKEKTDTETKQVLDQLLKDDFVDFKSSSHLEDTSLQPVLLPLATAKSEAEFTQVKIKVEKDMEVDQGQPEVKEEKDVAVDQRKKPVTHVKTPTCADLIASAQKTDVGELLFIQLPDVMPGVPVAQGDEGDAGRKPQKSANKSKEEDEEEVKKKLSTCSLAGFSEGPIGKLVFRKSGRTQLILGNMVLDVSMGTPCGFLQDLASVRVHETSGEMIVLGHIKHRLLCVPDFENLLQMT